VRFPCVHAVATTPAQRLDPIASLISSRRINLPRKGCRVGLRIVLFEDCSAFTHVAAITTWRETLTDKQRKRLRNPQAIVVRWRRSTAPAQANGSDDVAKAAAAWQCFIARMGMLPPDRAKPLWQDVQAQVSIFLGD